MKKYVIPVVLVLALLVGSAVYLIGTRVNYTAYETRLVSVSAYLSESGAETVADYGGRRTVVSPKNIEALLSRLTPASRQVASGPLPGAGEGPSITITFGDRYVVTAVQPEPEEAVDDTCYIQLSDADGSHVFRCKTTGLRTMYWLATTTGPDGIYGPNEVIG